MENPSKPQERDNPSPISTTTTTIANSGTLTPKPISRSDSNNSYPTTFVQADTNSFKQVVQMLTGSSDSPSKSPIPPKKQGFKLYERRNSQIKNNLIINTLVNNSGFSEILSPSLLDFPNLTLSPVTPLNHDDPFHNSSLEEDKAIAQKGFYLHPSPLMTPRDSEPQLLPLFPLSSPRVSSGSN